MGFVGINEAAAWECGAAFLDMMLKFGVLKKEDNNSWSLANDAHMRRIYSYGDRKTNENCAAFVSTLKNQPMSLEESSLQADGFPPSISQHDVHAW